MAHSIGKNLYFSFLKLETSYRLPSKKLSDLLKSHGIVQNNKKTAKWLLHLSKSLNFLEEVENIFIVLTNKKYKLFPIEWAMKHTQTTKIDEPKDF